MAVKASLSGFPEWLPDGRLVELQVLDTARRVFELHGFTSLETRSVEPIDVLLRKGEIDKEVYAVHRLHGDDDGRLALHFDLTVPFARYIVENAGQLAFPLRRYQIQKVWRGERPQEGRFREFTQADIDIIDVDHLAGHHDAEMAIIMAEVFASLPMPPTIICLNNRKVLEGFYRGLGVDDIPAVLRAIDKLDKIGREKVMALLVEAGLRPDQATACLDLADIRAADDSFVERVRALGVSDPLLDQGLAELAEVIRAVNRDHRAQRLSTSTSPAAWTTTPAPSTRHRSWASRISGRSAPVAVTTPSPPMGARPIQGWGSPSELPAWWPCFSGAIWWRYLVRFPRPCSSPSLTRALARRAMASPINSGPGGFPARWLPGPTSSASRSNTPTAGESLSCGSPTRPATQ